MALLLGFLPFFGLGEETASTEADRDRTTTTAAPTTTSPSSITTVPDPTGAYETGLGTWTWRRATGDLPEGRLAARDGRFVVANGERLWVSEDGVSWMPESMPDVFGGRAVQFHEVGGESWAFASPSWWSGEAAAFRQVEGQWVPLEIPASSLPETDGISWRYWPAEPAALGGTKVVSMLAVAEVDWSDLYGEFAPPDGLGGVPRMGPRPEWDGGVNDPVQLRHPFSGNLIATLGVNTVDGDPPALEFIDVETEAVVATVAAPLSHMTVADLKRVLLGGEPAQALLWVGSATGFDVVEPPWAAEGGYVQIAAADGRFVAYRNEVRGVARSGVQVWTSRDGRSWSRQPDLAFDGDPVTLVRVRQGPAGVLALANNEPGGFALWASPNGLSWEAGDLDVGGSGWTDVHSTPDGWILLDMAADGQVVIWLSEDGFAWEQLPEAAFLRLDSIARSGGSFGWEVAGDTVFVSGVSDRGIGTRFVGRLDRS